MSNKNILEKINQELPENWFELDPIQQLNFLVITGSEILQPPGDWILINSQMTLAQFLENFAGQTIAQLLEIPAQRPGGRKPPPGSALPPPENS